MRQWLRLIMTLVLTEKSSTISGVAVRTILPFMLTQDGSLLLIESPWILTTLKCTMSRSVFRNLGSVCLEKYFVMLILFFSKNIKTFLIIAPDPKGHVSYFHHLASTIIVVFWRCCLPFFLKLFSSDTTGPDRTKLDLNVLVVFRLKLMWGFLNHWKTWLPLLKKKEYRHKK